MHELRAVFDHDGESDSRHPVEVLEGKNNKLLVLSPLSIIYRQRGLSVLVLRSIIPSQQRVGIDLAAHSSLDEEELGVNDMSRRDRH